MTSARPVFNYKLGWSDNYGSLFRNSFRKITPAAELLNGVKNSGRALLVGKGGSGKTTVASRLVEAARQEGGEAYFVNMKLWIPTLEKEWGRLDASPLARMDLLLAELTEAAHSVAALGELDPNLTKYVVIDGLNEVHSRIAEQIVGAADALARTIIGLSVIATDRLVRRDSVSDQWILTHVLPLDAEDSRKAIEGAMGPQDWSKITSSQKRLLEIPFFLDKAIQDEAIGSNLADTINRYLTNHAFSSDELDRLARTAFLLYVDAGSRTFDLERLVAGVGDELAQKAIHSGVIQVEEQQGYFSHHLFHDYLAARYLAATEADWTYGALNAISFYASSFDAVTLVLQLLPAGKADGFVRKVYDWNPYAAAYALSDLDGDQVSNEMKFVIAAMLTDRLQDVFVKTAERSADALSILGMEEAERLQNASPDGARAIIQGYTSQSAWFSEWKRVMTEPSGAKPDGRTLELLSSADPILGWTAANTIRRQMPDREQLANIRKSTSDGLVPVRWRSVHVLGAFPSEESQEVVSNAFMNDENEWVRYGALRSLMEMAVRSTEMRVLVFSQIKRSVELLESQPQLRAEFIRSLFARDIEDKQTWRSGAGSIIEELADRAEDRRAFESWVRLGDRLEDFLAA
ncbi:hypothetical protein ACQR09_29070 [Bradyrhizobium oligotrophicum]|uniref:hypothetical protein n=1 Tax=Bradyrhizobium oligotrophicum TaxID=44255 RepID=UPI003EC021C3